MKWFSFLDSICFLEKNNIKCLDVFIIKSKKDLSSFKSFPYVMKISSLELLHKTDQGAVKTNIYSLSELKKSYENMLKIIKKKKIKADIILQKQIEGLELIIGIKEDKQFGKILMFGSGGIYTELLEDISIKLLPLNNQDLDKLINETKVNKILKGKRNIYYAKDKLKKLIKKISILAINKNIMELDLNPVIITKDEVYIVDARLCL